MLVLATSPSSSQPCQPCGSIHALTRLARRLENGLPVYLRQSLSMSASFVSSANRTTDPYRLTCRYQPI